MTVTGEIFFSKDKPELFPEEWNNHVGGKGSPTYGIQFDKEIKCLTGGKIVSVKVAEQTHVSTLDLEGFINKKCEMKGYFRSRMMKYPMEFKMTEPITIIHMSLISV